MFLLNVPCAILPIYLCYVGPENKPPYVTVQKAQATHLGCF